MSRFESVVLDASVTAKWFTDHEESDRDKALTLKRLHETGTCRLVAPEFSLLEVMNAIRYSPMGTEERTLRALESLSELQLEVMALDWEWLRRAVEISWAHQLALYDAAYVALSERLSTPFITADEAMCRKLKGHGHIVRLADLEV